MTTPISTEPAKTTASNKDKNSLAVKLYPTFTDDERNSRWKAVTSHAITNPNTFTNSTDRFAAILARADRITSDPRFKALDPSRQEHVLSNYYDRYVAPGYTSLGYTAPDKDLFIREMPKETGKLNSRAFYFSGDIQDPNSESGQRVAAGMGKEAGEVVKGMSYAGLWLTKKITNDALGLSHFLHLTDDVNYESYQRTAAQELSKAQNIVDKISNSISDSDKFWLQTHPSKRWTAQIDSDIGEQIIQLPLYTEIGALRLTAAAKAGELIPQLGRAANLTEKLSMSKGGQFLARRLAEGADAYIGATILNKNSSDKIGDMAAFMGFGSALEGAGSLLKYPTQFLIKQWTSRNLAVGGRVFQEAITDAADHELSNNILGHSHNGDPISIHPISADTGTIRIGDKEIPYANRDESQEAIFKSIQAHQQHDPVVASTVNAEKITLSAMGREKYNKPWNQLSQAQRRSIREARANLTEEAVSEVPLHNKDLVKMHVNVEDQAFKHQNPEYAQNVAMLEKLSGMKVTDALIQSEAEQLESETGVKQAQGTIEKIGKISNKVSRDEAKVQNLTKAGKSDEELEPRQFAQMKIDNLAYFVNRAKQAGSNKNLSAEIKDMDSDEFRREILEQMGHRSFHFENPEHALLWANSFRLGNQMPKPFQLRLIKELAELNPKETVKDWDKKSANLTQHMKELAYTERLFSQGNIFRSTQVDKWLSKTKWQLELREEVEQKELAELRKTMNRHTKQYRQAASALKNLQELRRKAATAEEYSDITDQIRGDE